MTLLTDDAEEELEELRETESDEVTDDVRELVMDDTDDFVWDDDEEELSTIGTQRPEQSAPPDD